MRLNSYQKKLLAAAAIGKPYGEPSTLDYLRRNGLLKIVGLEISLTETGRKALTE